MVPHRKVELPSGLRRPYVYSNFVQTLDGKTQAVGPGADHWPIGSAADYQGLLQLRARADVLIHGRKTASWTRTVTNLGSPEFQTLRRRVGKTKPILYVVVSAHPNKKLWQFVEAPPVGVSVLLATTKRARLSPEWRAALTVRIGGVVVSTRKLVDYLHQVGHRRILVEGGPTLLRHFFDEKVLDELFLTFAPKVFGGDPTETLGLIAGSRYAKDEVRSCQLVDHFALENEIYARYVLNEGRR